MNEYLGTLCARTRSHTSKYKNFVSLSFSLGVVCVRACVFEKWQAYLQLSRLLISTLRNSILIIMISFNFDSIWFSASFLPSLISAPPPFLLLPTFFERKHLCVPLQRFKMSQEFKRDWIEDTLKSCCVFISISSALFSSHFISLRSVWSFARIHSHVNKFKYR